MRIIAGSAKGRKLKTPKTSAIRPTSDRVREALFNIIGAAVVDARVLDLFAGTGALGIEALSRGAREAVFVDEDRSAVKLIADNLELAGFAGRATVVRERVESFLERQGGLTSPFNLIFLDPPYRMSVTALSNICGKAASGFLEAGGLMIFEHDAKTADPEVTGVILISSKRYGDTAVAIYRKEDARDDSHLSG
ncbi:MAG: 16S rRNA (guanine(966)-N(2))-methyltransferase RsmD [Candidatus Aquicultorales bacterium]